MKEFSIKSNLNFRLNLNFSRVITKIRGHLITHYTLSSISLDRLPFFQFRNIREESTKEEEEGL